MIKIKNPKIFKFSTFPEFNGTLIPFYINKGFLKKFKLERFFILYGKSKFFRADHAHKKCSQIIVPLKGDIQIFIQSKKYMKSHKLNVKKKLYLYLHITG